MVYSSPLFVDCCCPAQFQVHRRVASQSANQADAGLKALEHRWLQALQHHDTAFLQALLDDDFVDTLPEGRIQTKQDVLHAPFFQSTESETLSDLVVHLHGELAVVTGVNTILGTITIHFTDVFQKEHGEWKAIAAQETIGRPRPVSASSAPAPRPRTVDPDP